MTGGTPPTQPDPDECPECGHHYHGDSMCFALVDEGTDDEYECDCEGSDDA